MIDWDAPEYTREELATEHEAELAAEQEREAVTPRPVFMDPWHQAEQRYPFPIDDPERDAAMRASLGIETPEEVQARLLAEIDRLKADKLAWKREALRLGSEGLGGGRGT